MERNRTTSRHKDSDSSRPHRRSRSRERDCTYDPVAVAQALARTRESLSNDIEHNDELTRKARRLYIGNMPNKIGMTEEQIHDLFTTTVTMLGITTPRPITNVWLSTDKNFVFVEFRAIQDCSMCLRLLQGMKLDKRLLRVGRQGDYQEPPSHLANYVAGLPAGADASSPPTFANNAPFMQRLFAGQSPFTHPEMMLLLDNTPATTSSSQEEQQQQATATPTPIVLLEHMIDLSDLSHDEDFLDLLQDVEEEAEKLGPLRGIVIPRPIAPADAPPTNSAPSTSSGPRVPLGQGTGRVFLHYGSVDSAIAAQAKMHNRHFNTKRIAASFWPADKFASNKYA
jgi:hypothetical protein